MIRDQRAVEFGSVDDGLVCDAFPVLAIIWVGVFFVRVERCFAHAFEDIPEGELECHFHTSARLRAEAAGD